MIELLLVGQSLLRHLLLLLQEGAAGPADLLVQRCELRCVRHLFTKALRRQRVLLLLLLVVVDKTNRHQHGACMQILSGMCSR